MHIAWSQFAVEDRAALFEYIAADNAQAAVRIDLLIEGQTELLIRHPQLGRVGRVENTRELVIDGTPFIAVYTKAQNSVKP